MQKSGTILALFKDSEDERLNTPLLAGINNIIRVVAGENLSLSLDNLKRIGIEPSLALISRRLYPEEKPGVAALLKRLFPAAELLLLSAVADPFPPFSPLVADRVRHLAINPVVAKEDEESLRSQFRTTVTRLVENAPMGMRDYLRPGTTIHEVAVTASSQKEELIAGIEAVVAGDDPDLELLRQRGALLADELLENAMYGAPRGEEGEKLYRKGEERTVLPDEGIVFRFGFDGQILAMEVADNWGSLSPEQVLEHLARNQEEEASFEETGGRGLFIIWRFLDHFHVTIRPGRQTVVGGHVRAYDPLDPGIPRGYHITTHR